jgi:hypothetical protein
VKLLSLKNYLHLSPIAAEDEEEGGLKSEEKDAGLGHCLAGLNVILSWAG